MRFLWHQFHDDLTGTSIPEAYTLSWNDETISAGTFADVLGSSVGAVSRALDTRGDGIPLVVHNPLALEREDAVEANVRFPGRGAACGAGDGPGRPRGPGAGRRAGRSAGDGRLRRARRPGQLLGLHGPPGRAAGGTRAGGRRRRRALRPRERADRVKLDATGNVASVFDKLLGRELLSAPLALQLFEDEPRKWSAWEVEYSALSAPPREVVAGPAKVRVVEAGPARAAVEVVRQAAGSTFTQTLRLAAGAAGDRLEVVTDVDWRTKGTLLKAAFPLAAANRTATYDLGLGVVDRGTNRPNAHEVPAQQWADVTDASGAFSVAVLNDNRHGWDRPDEQDSPPLARAHAEGRPELGLARRPGLERPRAAPRRHGAHGPRRGRPFGAGRAVGRAAEPAAPGVAGPGARGGARQGVLVPARRGAGGRAAGLCSRAEAGRGVGRGRRAAPGALGAARRGRVPPLRAAGRRGAGGERCRGAGRGRRDGRLPPGNPGRAPGARGRHRRALVRAVSPADPRGDARPRGGAPRPAGGRSARPSLRPRRDQPGRGAQGRRFRRAGAEPRGRAPPGHRRLRRDPVPDGTAGAGREERPRRARAEARAPGRRLRQGLSRRGRDRRRPGGPIRASAEGRRRSWSPTGPSPSGSGTAGWSAACGSTRPNGSRPPTRRRPHSRGSRRTGTARAARTRRTPSRTSSAFASTSREGPAS